MESKKKYIIIVLLVSVFVTLFFLCFINYKINVINKTKNDIDSITKIKKFQDELKIQKKNENYQEHQELSGGIEINEIFIDGSHELYSYYNFEKQKIIKERINKTLLIWIPSLKKLKNHNIKEFYYENQIEITNRFACDTLDKFKTLVKEIKSINSIKIKSCSMDINTIEAEGNITRFNLKVQFDGTFKVFKIRVIEDNLEVDNKTKEVFNVFLEIA